MAKAKADTQAAAGAKTAGKRRTTKAPATNAKAASKAAPKRTGASTPKAASVKATAAGMKAPGSKKGKASLQEEAPAKGTPAVAKKTAAAKKPAANKPPAKKSSAVAKKTPAAKKPPAKKPAAKKAPRTNAKAPASKKTGVTKAAAALKTTTAEQKGSAKATSAKKPTAAKKTPAAKKAATPKKTSAAEKAPARQKTTAAQKQAAKDKAAGKKPAAAEEEVPAGKAEGAGAKAPAKKAAATRKRGREVTTEAEPRQLPGVEHHTHQKVPGHMFVIGDADCGQFGLGEDEMSAPRPRPTDIAGKQVLQVVTGGMHTMALTDDFQVWTTGVNDEGALGRPTDGDVWKEVEVPKASSYTWGRVEVPTEHGKVVQLAAGDSHSLALTEQGGVYGWGTYRNTQGVYGFSPTQRIAASPTLVYVSPGVTPAAAQHDQIVQIAAGDDHDLALTRAGTILSWGAAGQGQLGRTTARTLDAARSEDKLKHQLLTPAPVKLVRRGRVASHSKVVEVATGSYGSFALTEEGHVWAWGLNQYGQLGIPGEEPLYSPMLVNSLHGHTIRSLKGGQHHTLALTQDGKLLSFGRPTYGRLGRKTDLDCYKDTANPTPAAVEGLEGHQVEGFNAGIMVSGCFNPEGGLWMWGANTNSQLGKGDEEEDELVPLKVRETKRFQNRKVIQLEIGSQWVVMLTTDKGAGAGPSGTQAPTSTPAAIPAVADGPSSAAADPPSSSAAPPPPPAGPAADGGEVQPAAGQEVPPPPPPTSEAPAASTAESASLAPAAQAPTQVPASAAASSHPSAPPTSSAATAVGAGAGPSAAGTQAANGVPPAAPSLPNGLAQGSRATQVTGFPAGAGPPPPPPPPTSLGHDSDGVNGLGAGGPGADTGAAFLLQDPITEEPLPTPRDNGMAVGDEEMAQAPVSNDPDINFEAAMDMDATQPYF